VKTNINIINYKLKTGKNQKKLKTKKYETLAPGRRRQKIG